MGAEPAATHKADDAVVGAGPGGLAAALELARGGRRVLLVDEQADAGGQYFRRTGHGAVREPGGHRPEGARLIAAARAAGVRFLTGHTVWGVDDDRRTLLANGPDGSAVRVTAEHLVVATGAFERSIPFPGWQLPGVVTPGLAQHMAAEGVPVGRRVLVAGSGPFLLPVACSLLERGAHVVAVAEAGTPYRPGPATLGAALFPGRLLEAASYAARLARHRVPLLQDTVVAEAQGSPRVSLVGLARLADPAKVVSRHEVDALCVGYGFRPQADLVQLMGCRTQEDPATGDRLPVLTPTGRSSRADVYVVGEAAGIAGAPTAMARGRAAALDILRTAGREPGRARRRAAALRTSRLARFTRLTSALYPSPAELLEALVPALDDRTLVCRCEGIAAGRVREGSSLAGGSDVPALKGDTRAGMGPCQSRECGPALAVLRGAAGAGGGASVPARTPLRPLALETVLGMDRGPAPSDPEEAS